MEKAIHAALWCPFCRKRRQFVATKMRDHQTHVELTLNCMTCKHEQKWETTREHLRQVLNLRQGNLTANKRSVP